MYVYIKSDVSLWTVGFYHPKTNAFIRESEWLAWREEVER